MVGEDDVGLVFQERYAIQRGCLELLGSRRLSTSIEEPWISTGHVWREEWKESTLGWSDVMKGVQLTQALSDRAAACSRAPKKDCGPPRSRIADPRPPFPPLSFSPRRVIRESPQKSYNVPS
ncbi:hypothetical protein PGT21_015972 [Puccinia graminis f. sp. tritici]|uniref:Uncharacterized protein n=1 Tax=Puccinia graminis f. sp. tritici TaxID=56615 RepID=A0A5B0PTX3_PUCGR|nr:hypothetical protein PGT21_015972 [Puccinia graminis f. sp. tritici]